MHNIVQIQSVINPFLLFLRFLLIMTIFYVNSIMSTRNTKSPKNKGFFMGVPIYCDVFLQIILYIGYQTDAVIEKEIDCYLYNHNYGNVIIKTNCSFLSGDSFAEDKRDLQYNGRSIPPAEKTCTMYFLPGANPSINQPLRVSSEVAVSLLAPFPSLVETAHLLISMRTRSSPVSKVILSELT